MGATTSLDGSQGAAGSGTAVAKEPCLDQHVSSPDKPLASRTFPKSRR